jgi:putative tryptophan/tyrosine transport system substrate-binding protein
MRRRDVVKFGGAAALPLWLACAGAQQRTPVIGFLHSQSSDGYDNMVAGFPEGLREQGFIVGQNVEIEYRWADNQPDRLPALAAELVRRQVALIVAAGGAAPAAAAKAATSTIPIVFANGADPVRQGLVTSLNRPGGNITGVTFITTELGTKRLGLLRELLPKAATVGYLTTDIANEERTSDIVAAARVLGCEMVVATSHDAQYETAFASFVERKAAAVLIGASASVNSHRARLTALADRHRLPTMYPDRVFAVEGGLISYGTSILANYRQAGVYAGRILKGEKAGELPVQQSVRFEFVINLKTARALDLKVPDMVLALADEVIE